MKSQIEIEDNKDDMIIYCVLVVEYADAQAAA